MNTHNLYIFKVPKISQNYKYLHKKMTQKNYACTIYILFTSWHTIFNIKSYITISWGMTLNNVYPLFTNLQKIKF